MIYRVTLVLLLLFISRTFILGQSNLLLNDNNEYEAELIFPNASESSEMCLSGNNEYLVTVHSNTAIVWDIKIKKIIHFLKGHTDIIRSVKFNSNDSQVLTTSDDGTVRIWDLKRGCEILKINQGRKILSASFSPDNNFILTTSNDGYLRIWDILNGVLVNIININRGLFLRAEFCSNGKYVLTTDDSLKARIWDLKTNSCLNENRLANRHWVIDIGKQFFLSVLSPMILYDINTLEQVKTFEQMDVRYAKLNHSESNILTVSKDFVVRIKDINTGMDQSLLKVNKRCNSAEFSKDDTKVYISAEDVILIWDLKINKVIDSIVIKQNILNRSAIIFENQIVTLLDDNTIKVNNLWIPSKRITLSGHTSFVRTAHYRFGDLLTTSYDSTIRIWDLESGKEKSCIITDNITRDARYSRDKKYFLSLTGFGIFNHDSIVYIWDSINGCLIHKLKGHNDYIHGAYFSPNSNFVASFSDSTTILWRIDKGVPTYQKYLSKERVKQLDFSPDSQHLAVSSDHKVSIHRTDSGEKVIDLDFSKKVLSVEFNCDNSILIVASSDNNIYLWNTENWTLQNNFKVTNLVSAELSQDCTFLIINTVDSVLIWNSNSNNSFVKIKDNGLYLREIHSSIDDEFIISSEASGRVTIWNPISGTRLFSIQNLNNNDWLVYDEDYRFDGSPGAIDYLYLTCGLEVIDLAQVKDSLWVPGLAEKIMKKEPILINDKPAPKLSDLNICELTPLIEPLENGEKGLYRYQITPRNGGLGETEVYINGNLTYTFMPQQLERKVVKQKEIYFLTISKDSLAPFLVGGKYTTNPLMVKSKVKGASIYGRGVQIDVEKDTDATSPSFYGVFIGVNDYANESKENNDYRYKNLDFAKKDADDLANAVEATARNLFKDSCHIYKLTGLGIDPNAPTKDKLQEVLTEIGKNAKSSDVLFIFFAGHGDIIQANNQKEIRFILHRADKKNLLSSSFGLEELKQWCDPKLLKAQKRVFVFDACHSGELINQTMAFNGRGDEEGLRIRQLDKLKDKNGMMILAAAADNEFAYEDETLNQGVLTYHLLEVIKTQEKDTFLTIRNWFDETIELVKEYSRVNGNQQEPNSFGDGRFEIGNINNEVRESIQITCPKTRIGMNVFTDPTGKAELIYPELNTKINQYFSTTSSRGGLVYSKNLDKAYRVEGSYRIEKNKVFIRYKVYLGNELKGTAINLDPMKGLSEDELVARITKSVQQEIERVDQRAEKCKLKI